MASDELAYVLKQQRPRRALKWLAGGLAALFIVLLMLGVGAAVLLQGGPITNERLRSTIEAQLSQVIPNGLDVKIDAANIALARNGLLSVEARNVRILRESTVSLGIADTVSVNLRALPLLGGHVVAERLVIDQSSISLLPLAHAIEAQYPDTGSSEWPAAIDFAGIVKALGQRVAEIASTIENAGLQSVVLQDSNLVGFDQLALRPRQARLRTFRLEKNSNFQDGLFIEGILDTDKNTISLNGSWQPIPGGGNVLTVELTGLDMRDVLFNAAATKNFSIIMDSAVTMRVVLPFDDSGDPKDARLVVRLDGGRFNLADSLDTEISGAELNFLLIADKNQIELENSPIQFAATAANLSGGLRYPKPNAASIEERPLFELLANDLRAFGMSIDEAPGEGALRVSGYLEPESRTVVAKKLELKTLDGSLSGTGRLRIGALSPAVDLDLTLSRMPVDRFKQFWPPILAPEAHQWARDGIGGGEVTNASVRMSVAEDFLAGDEPFSSDQLSANLPVSGANIKTVGELPVIKDGIGTVAYSGTKTVVSLSSGTLNTSDDGALEVRDGELDFGSYTQPDEPVHLSLNLSGSLSDMARLGAREPLGFTKSLDVEPSDLDGRIAAAVKASFKLDNDLDAAKIDWTAKATIEGGGSKRSFEGRRISNADLDIAATREGVTVKGKANIDGLPAQLALTQSSGEGLQRSVTLTLDAAARKKMGVDAGAILQGPIGVSISSAGKESDVVEADLQNTRLDFPWIGWSKGKGIPASAKFSMKKDGNETRLENFRLAGTGFNAAGTIILDESGLVRADMSKVVLNKTDNFAVDVKRNKAGFDVSVNAKSYDGRSLISSLMNNDQAAPKGGLTVSVRGTVGRLIGFNGQVLEDVDLDFRQQGERVLRANVTAVAAGRSPTVFSMKPVSKGMRTRISTTNAGSILSFLDLYTKAQGGELSVNLVRNDSQEFRGTVEAKRFTLLNEPRLGALLTKPTQVNNLGDRGREIVNRLPQYDPNRANVDTLQARITKGRGFLRIRKGRLSGGDASAAFEGTVYDRRNRMDIKGTFLPARALNKLVSNIPVLGLAFGRGSKYGLLGITFRLRGPFRNPQIAVNPLSIIAPGVFRKIFEF